MIVVGIGFALEAASTAELGFDVGFGDFWKAPLGEGYELYMLDSPDQASIATPDGRRVADRLLRLGFDRVCVYAETSEGRFLLVKKSTGAETAELSADELTTAVDRIGGSKPRLRTATAVYHELREQRGSGAGMAIVVLAPVLLAAACWWYLRRLHAHRATRVIDAGWPPPRGS